jgi:N-acetylmuramoyl-L-alanine amidase
VGGVSVGGVAENNFTPKQMSTLWSLLGDLAIFFPEARVVGHGDLPRVTKACPSFNVADWLNTRRPA